MEEKEFLDLISEKEECQQGKLYDANNNAELIAERQTCKAGVLSFLGGGKYSVDSLLFNSNKRWNEKVIIELFLENDDKKIKEYYTTLIEEIYEKVDNKILESSDGDVIKRLVEVKQKLKSLKGQIPNIKTIENILDLKENFE